MSTTENLFGFEQVRVNDKVETTLIFEEINKKLEEYLLEKSNDADSTDGVFDLLGGNSNRFRVICNDVGAKSDDQLTKGYRNNMQMLKVIWN